MKNTKAISGLLVAFLVGCLLASKLLTSKLPAQDVVPVSSRVSSHVRFGPSNSFESSKTKVKRRRISET